MKVAVLIRVYDRIEDLKCNLQIIADTWHSNEYYIIVVSNGRNQGYEIDEPSLAYIDKLVVLEQNAGHRKGNSQLLMEGMKYIPADCEYTLILEADTWMYKDSLISKYISVLQNNPKAVWASADWYDKYIALATDFAIIKSNYIKENTQLFDFELFPECYVANVIRDTSTTFTWITENMPVHVPSYMFKYPYIHNNERRFYVFPKSKMVTHHIEFLKDGMQQKKRYFNIISDVDYFEDNKVKNKKWQRLKMNFWIGLSQCLLKRSWYSKKKYKNIEE